MRLYFLSPKPRFSRRRGTALLEFALVVPVFIAFLAATIDLGLLINHQLVLTDAVREGARAASFGSTPAQAAAVVTDALTASGFTPLPPANAITVATTPDSVSITAIAPVPFMFASSGPPITLHATTTVRRE